MWPVICDLCNVSGSDDVPTEDRGNLTSSSTGSQFQTVQKGIWTFQALLASL